MSAFFSSAWASRINATAFDSASRASEARGSSVVMPTTSASISVLMPWQYIGPWLVRATTRPLGFWLATTNRMPRSIVSRYGPGSPGRWPQARKAITDNEVMLVASPNEATHAPLGFWVDCR